MPSRNRDLNEDGVIDSTEVYGINDYESAQIINVNPLFDGVYTENISQRQNAAAALLAKKTNPWVNLEATDLYPGMTRTLEVNIEKDPATGFVSVIVYDHYLSPDVLPLRKNSIYRMDFPLS